MRASSQVCRTCFGKGKDRRPRELNEMSGKEWAAASRSVEQYPDIRSPKQRLHGASFPQSLAEQHIRMFTKRGQVVLDPFLGVGTTLDAALLLRRRGIGIELNRRFARIAEKDAKRIPGFRKEWCRIIVDDARNMRTYLHNETVDFILTSPPYSTLLKNSNGHFAYKWKEHSTIPAIANPKPYSSKLQDLGNVPYPDYLEGIRSVFAGCYQVLKPESYSVWVVKDFRDLKHGIPYVSLHSDIISCGVSTGFRLWDIRIYDQTRYRPLVCLGFPSRNFYLNISHSYIIIFKKVGRCAN